METTDLASVRWIHGAPDCDRSTDPPLQVVAVDEDTFVIRQSKCVNFEAPFLYLLLGTETALLHDTGATADADLFPIRRTVEELIAGRSLRTRRHALARPRRPLGGGCAVRGSSAGIGRADRRRRGRRVLRHRGMARGDATLDLGDRPIDVLPTPGHLGDHIVLFDRTRGLLLSGDTLLPGTLTVRDWPAFLGARARLAAVRPRDGGGGRPITHILGAHIEMSTTGRAVRAGDDLPAGRGPAAPDGRGSLRARGHARGGR